MEDVKKRIDDEVKKHKVIMYIKGEKGAPQCGFSAAVMEVFDEIGEPYETRNVLADPEIRDGIKQYTQWPTIPQVFINGQFIGGCDIVRDLFHSGELAPMVKTALGK